MLVYNNFLFPFSKHPNLNFLTTCENLTRFIVCMDTIVGKSGIVLSHNIIYVPMTVWEEAQGQQYCPLIQDT